MKENGIKHTGSPLDRPKLENKQQNDILKNNERNHLEGKIGPAKQKFGMDKLRTKAVARSLCAINLIALAMNMLAIMNAHSSCLYYSFQAILYFLINTISLTLEKIATSIIYQLDISRP